MISIAILLVLAWSFYIGYNRGLALQGYYVLASLLALVIAVARYKELASLFYLWVPFASATEGSSTYFFDNQYLFEMDSVFYAGLAFFVIYMMTYTIFRFIGIFVNFARFVVPDNRTTTIIAGVLSIVVTVIGLQMVLTILATIPQMSVQDSLNNSWVASALIKYTPITSNLLQDLWVTQIVGS